MSEAVTPKIRYPVEHRGGFPELGTLERETNVWALKARRAKMRMRMRDVDGKDGRKER